MPQEPHDKTFFIVENDRINVFDKSLEIFNVKNSSQKLKKELSEVFNKTYNNYVGFYLFKDKNEYIKIFVLPKTITAPKNDLNKKQAISNFIKYLSEFYRLKSKYGFDKKNYFSIKSYTEYSSETKKSTGNTQSIEDLLFYRNMSILQNIKLFFKRHRNSVRVKRNYTSQTIKHKLDILANIREPNKTKLHQVKTEDIIYSEMAKITYATIKLFIKNKVTPMKSKKNKAELLKLSAEVKNLLLKKFQIHNGYKITLPMLLSVGMYKYFRKKSHHKQLYLNMMGLFGIEHFLDGKEDRSSLFNIQSESLFFDPSIMYEWHIYDKLKKHLDKNRYTIKFDKKEGTSIEYWLKNSKDSEAKTITSNPDIIIWDKKSKKTFVIDAKWKDLKKKSLELNDILKLKRDCEVRQEDVYAIFIYPCANEFYYQEYLYNKTEVTFSFYIRQISYDDNIFNFDLIKNKAIIKDKIGGARNQALGIR